MDFACNSVGINNLLCSKDRVVFTPITIILLTISYVVIAKMIGPHFMKNRAAIGNTPELILKTIQLGINSYVFFNLILYGWIKINYTFGASTENTSMELFDMGQIFMLYFIGKAFELLESVLFVFNKKTKKITNPHLLYHALTMSFVWLTLVFESNSISFFFALLNTFIQLSSCAQYLYTTSKYFDVLEEIQFITMIFQAYVLVFLNTTIPKPIILGILSMFIIVFIAFYIDPENEKNKDFRNKYQDLKRITLAHIIKANMLM